MYDEVLSPKSKLLQQQWIYAPEINEPLFSVSESQYADENTVYFKQKLIINTVPDKPDNKYIEVTVSVESGNTISARYVPKKVNMTVYYYQYSKTVKKITQFKIEFGDLVNYDQNLHELPENKGYTFYFNLVPWTWYEVMNNFKFNIAWYIVVLILMIFVFQCVLFLMNFVARKTTITGGVPEYNYQASIAQGIASLIGWLMSLAPFGIVIVAAKLLIPYVEFGQYYVDSGIGIDLRNGRLGGTLFIIGSVGLVYTSILSTPHMSVFNKDCKLFIFLLTY